LSPHINILFLFFFAATTLPVLWNATATTVAGFTLGGGTSASQLHLPYSLAVDSSFAVYIADRFNHRIQKWTVGAGSATTVAGQANCVSGTALNYLTNPCDVLVDSNFNLYVADTWNNRVLFFTVGATFGTIVAGNGR
jgi:hypothetical protein